MNFSDYAKTYLVGRGMLPDQAEQVVQMAKSSEELSPMADRWNDDVNGYPDGMVVAFGLSLSLCAKRWVDENTPSVILVTK